MRTDRVLVRFVVIVSIAGIGGAAIGCGDRRTATSPAGLSSGATGAFPQDTAGVLFTVPPELAAVRGATARFHDLNAANAAGYVIPPGEPCVPTPVGVMGIHAPNLPLMGDQQLDPLRPELLLYVPRANGGVRLVGVEYFQAVLLRNLRTGAVAPRLQKEPWNPEEYEVVTETPALFGQTFDGPMPGHIDAMPWHWDLHVWVWANNPIGMFAEGNPALSCN